MIRSFISLFLLTLSIIFVSPTWAKDLPFQATSGATNKLEKRMLINENVKQRIEDAKLKACQAKEKAIKQRSEMLIKMANNMLEKFDTKSTKVQEFYNLRIVTLGVTVNDYESLVLKMSDKKASVNSVIESAKADFLEFNCSTDNPKERLVEFRHSMENVKEALKEYRTSIKDLIVAIHSAIGKSKSEDNRGSTKSGRPL